MRRVVPAVRLPQGAEARRRWRGALAARARRIQATARMRARRAVAGEASFFQPQTFLVHDPGGSKVVKGVTFGPGDKKCLFCKVASLPDSHRVMREFDGLMLLCCWMHAGDCRLHRRRQ